MFFRKKKSRDDTLKTSSVLTEKNAAQIDFLLTLADGNPHLVQKLKEAQIKIKYFSPTAHKQASDLDKKIESRIGDLKIALSKAKSSGNYGYCDELTGGLLLLVAERKSITA